MNYKVKIALVGDFSIGKSSLLETYVNENEKTAINATIGVDFRHSIVHRENYTYKLHLWDTAGQEKFQAIVTSYFRDLDVAIIIFDMTNINSFNNLDKWVNLVSFINKNENLLIYLVGHKIDCKEREILNSTINKKVKFFDCKYFETTIKNPESIKKLFKQIVDDVHELNIKGEIDLKTYYNLNEFEIKEYEKEKEKQKKRKLRTRCCLIQ